MVIAVEGEVASDEQVERLKRSRNIGDVFDFYFLRTPGAFEDVHPTLVPKLRKWERAYADRINYWMSERGKDNITAQEFENVWQTEIVPFYNALSELRKNVKFYWDLRNGDD